MTVRIDFFFFFFFLTVRIDDRETIQEIAIREELIDPLVADWVGIFLLFSTYWEKGYASIDLSK